MDFMFKQNKWLILLMLAVFLTDSVFADNVSTTKKDSQLKQFKQAQKCYVDSVANETWKKSLDCANESLSLGRELFGSGHKNIAALIHNYGLMLAKNGEHREAVRQLKKVQKLYKKHYGKKSETLGWLIIDLADVQGEYHPRWSSKNYIKGFEILDNYESFDPMVKAEIALDASVQLSGQGLSSSSIKNTLMLARQAYEFYFNAYGAKHTQTSLAAFVIGKLNYLKGDYPLAESFLERSLENSNYSKYAHGILIDIYTKNGRSDLVEKHRHALGLLAPKQKVNSDYMPVFVMDPEYPKRALRGQKSGYAVVVLTITKQGGVKDPHVMYEYPKNLGFGTAALEAASKLKYVPQVKDGKAIEVSNVFYKYSFIHPRHGVSIRHE